MTSDWIDDLQPLTLLMMISIERIGSESEFIGIKDQYPIAVILGADANNEDDVKKNIRTMVADRSTNRSVVEAEINALHKLWEDTRQDKETNSARLLKLLGHTYDPTPAAWGRGHAMSTTGVAVTLGALQNPDALLPETRSHSFDELRDCINTVETALRGTNWERALNDATRMAFACLWIAFVMARHAHPTFPTVADWGVLARMKTPLLSRRCLYERRGRKYGEPQWDASCFHANQLTLGTDSDSEQLYIESNGQWIRSQLGVSPGIGKAMVDQLLEEQKAFSSGAGYKIDNELWNLVGDRTRQ